MLWPSLEFRLQDIGKDRVSSSESLAEPRVAQAGVTFLHHRRQTPVQATHAFRRWRANSQVLAERETRAEGVWTVHAVQSEQGQELSTWPWVGSPADLAC